MPRRRKYTVKAKKDSWLGKYLVFTPENWRKDLSIVRKRSSTNMAYFPFKTTRDRK